MSGDFPPGFGQAGGRACRTPRVGHRKGKPRVDDSVGTLPSGPGVNETWPYRKHDPRPGVPPDPPIARAVVDSARARRAQGRRLAMVAVALG